MPGNISNGIGLQQCSSERYQRLVLNIGKRLGIGALKLYANGKIVAAGLTLPTGFSGMPSPLLARHELDSLPVSADEKMSGNFKAADSPIIGMSFGIKPVGKKLDHSIAAEFFRRQADVVNHQQAYLAPGGAFIAIGRRNYAYVIEAILCINLH
jgi:hypothetical protein